MPGTGSLNTVHQPGPGQAVVDQAEDKFGPVLHEQRDTVAPGDPLGLQYPSELVGRRVELAVRPLPTLKQQQGPIGVLGHGVFKDAGQGYGLFVSGHFEIQCRQDLARLTQHPEHFFDVAYQTTHVSPRESVGLARYRRGCYSVGGDATRRQSAVRLIKPTLTLKRSRSSPSRVRVASLYSTSRAA